MYGRNKNLSLKDFKSNEANLIKDIKESFIECGYLEGDQLKQYITDCTNIAHFVEVENKFVFIKENRVFNKEKIYKYIKQELKEWSKQNDLFKYEN